MEQVLLNKTARNMALRNMLDIGPTETMNTRFDDDIDFNKFIPLLDTLCTSYIDLDLDFVRNPTNKQLILDSHNANFANDLQSGVRQKASNAIDVVGSCKYHHFSERFITRLKTITFTLEPDGLNKNSYISKSLWFIHDQETQKCYFTGIFTLTPASFTLHVDKKLNSALALCGSWKPVPKYVKMLADNYVTNFTGLFANEFGSLNKSDRLLLIRSYNFNIERDGGHTDIHVLSNYISGYIYRDFIRTGFITKEMQLLRTWKLKL